MLTFLVFGLVIFAIPAQAQENAGYVLSIDGSWYLRGARQQLKQWQKLPGGVRIVAGKTIDKSSHITIALFNGETINRTCDDGRKCNAPLVIPGNSPAVASRQRPVATTIGRAQSSLRQRIANAFWSIFEHPEIYMVPTFARNESDLSFQEAVVAWNSGRVNLSPVFKNMPAGSYPLATAPTVTNAQPISPSDSIRIVINWEPDNPASAITDKLKPGLYRLVGERSYEAWVLVTPPEQYEAANNSFQQAIETTRRWGKTVDPATVQMFLRAYLETLAKAD